MSPSTLSRTTPRRAAAAALALLFVAGCGGGRSEPRKVRADGLAISVATEPATSTVGDNALWIHLADAEDQPVTGAHLEVEVRMPAMGAMPAMGGPATVSELGDGRYRADYRLDMGGSWQIAITAKATGGRVTRVEGSLTVGTPGLQLADGAGEAAEAARGAEEPHPGEFRMEPGRVQKVGVRTAVAEMRPLVSEIRAVGRVVAEESTLADVALKVRGWVGEVRVRAVGDPVERGQVLFTVYGPELYGAQEELLQALRSQERARSSGAPERADDLVRAARRRLALWDVAPADVERVERAGAPLEELPIRAPVSGYVVEKGVVEGSAFEPGMRLYRIAPLSQVWVEAQVYEFELPDVRVGQAATVSLPYQPGRSFDATVSWVYPTLDPATRTARVRLALPNPELALRPEMYADVRLRVDRGERLLVPQSAVLNAGERSFVFRALGDGRFRPQQVEVGLRSGEDVEVTQGLAPGDAIVASGTFLIASESRLRAAMDRW